ncbi:MAG: hypothetical protein V1719_01285 [Patescibacteria group bacterium]
MEPIDNSNIPNHNLPPDMWDDHPTAPTPTSPPTVPPPPTSPTPRSPIAPNHNPPAFRSPHRNWLQWWLTLVVILVVTGGVGYTASRYWMDVADWATSLIKSGPIIINNSTSENIDDQIAWQQRELIGDLNLMKPIVVPEGSSGPSGEPVIPARYYKVGEFVSGPYNNQDLVIADLLMVGGLGEPRRFYYFAKNNQNSLVLLAKHSPELDEYDGIDHNKFSVDTSYQIARLFFPNKIKNPRTDLESLELMDQSYSGFGIGISGGDGWFDTQKAKNNWQKVFVDSLWADVYTDPIPTSTELPTNQLRPNYGFYLEAPDGTPRTYKLIPNILGASDTVSADIPVFSWADKSLSTDEYIMFEMGGCGQGNLAAVVPTTLLDELVLATNPKQVIKIYEFQDKNHPMLKALFEMARSRFDNEGLTYQKFLSNHPIFFWQDSFGRLIKFQNKNYIPLAECGKPVIYLYPEKRTKVSVKVEPQGGLSYSVPEYKDGWEVWAEPTGKLTEILTNQVYPYLFWEGRGGLYQSPEQGWVVKQSEVSKFLDDKLGKFGLIAQEIADFKEFWLPRMQDAPYYFIGFWDTPVMNVLAPLSITPQPNTVMRILMDFKPLNQPISVKEPEIITHQRKGFTVVEWGGVLQ